MVSDQGGEHLGSDETLPLTGGQPAQELAQRGGRSGGERGVDLVSGEVALDQAEWLVLQEPGENRYKKFIISHLTRHLLANNRKTVYVLLRHIDEVRVSPDHGRQQVMELEHQLPLDGVGLRS